MTGDNVLPEWTKKIRQRLASLKLDPAREAEIIDELAQHLQDRYRELRLAGATDEAAHETALAELSKDNDLARELARVERAVSPEPVVSTRISFCRRPLLKRISRTSRL